MIGLRVIGEYIAKIYDEIKQRPTSIVDRMHEPAVLSRGAEEGCSMARREGPTVSGHD